MANIQTNSPYKGSGSLTRGQFLFFEMRITAKLMTQGLEDRAICEKIQQENLFQFPTERMIRNIANVCIKRLKALDNSELVSAIAEYPTDAAKQICLYAMMRQYRLMWDFMITVIGEKFRTKDMSLTRRDLNTFFMELQEQDECVASWGEATVQKIISVIVRSLVEVEYLENNKSTVLQPILIEPILEDAIRSSGDTRALAAFNDFL